MNEKASRDIEKLVERLKNEKSPSTRSAFWERLWKAGQCEIARDYAFTILEGEYSAHERASAICYLLSNYPELQNKLVQIYQNDPAAAVLAALSSDLPDKEKSITMLLDACERVEAFDHGTWEVILFNLDQCRKSKAFLKSELEQRIKSRQKSLKSLKSVASLFEIEILTENDLL